MAGFFRRFRKSKGAPDDDAPAEPESEATVEEPKSGPEEDPPSEELHPPAVDSEQVGRLSSDLLLRVPTLESSGASERMPSPPTPAAEPVAEPATLDPTSSSEIPSPPGPAPPPPTSTLLPAPDREPERPSPPPPLPAAEPAVSAPKLSPLAPSTRCFLCGSEMDGSWCPTCKMVWND